MKKLFTILLALALLVSLCSVAMATKITVEGGANGSVYSAYKLLNATDGGSGKIAYTFNEKYTAILQAITGKTEINEVVDYILSKDNDAGIREFADAVYQQIADAVPAIEADYVSEDGVFADVAQGYYLIAETEVGDPSDTFSLVMLKTAGQDDITVFTKEDKPTVVKKVLEKNDSTNFSEWGDSADHDIGDNVEYYIRGTLSSKYALYDSYYYSFTDEMVKGLTYNEDAKVYVVNGENEYEVTEYFQIKLISNDETELAGFMAEGNLKEIDAVCEEFEITADSVIMVKYTALLNENAVKGPQGNPNYVYLEYEANPYLEADGEIDTTDRPGDDGSTKDKPGKTPIDINIVFTIDSVVNKVDKDGNALEGAGFTLYKWIKTDDAEGWEQIGDERSGATTFVFEGLDSGIYKLVETTIPAGYNECKPVEFEVACEYNKDVDPHTMTALKVYDREGNDISTGDDAMFNATLELGQISANIVNLTGVELPETGGIGTTIFYIVGAVLALGAIVLLVAMKRMKAEE